MASFATQRFVPSAAAGTNQLPPPTGLQQVPGYFWGTINPKTHHAIASQVFDDTFDGHAYIQGKAHTRGDLQRLLCFASCPVVQADLLC